MRLLVVLAGLGALTSATHEAFGMVAGGPHPINCGCNSCSGLPAVPTSTVINPAGPNAGVAPGDSLVANVPVLSSYPSARVKVYLDFSGINFVGTWGSSGKSPGNVPAYDIDNNPATFNNAELSNINQIWARVAEAFSPFNVDVTTVDPGTPAFRKGVRVVVGGSNAWYSANAGGVANIGGYTYATESFGTAWVFPANLGSGDPTYVAAAAIHETGHLFGLYHQQDRAANGALISSYRQTENDDITAPWLGTAYFKQRGTWSNGTIGFDGGNFTRQDERAQIASSPISPYSHPYLGTAYNNDFGLRPDDYGNTIVGAPFLLSGGGRFVLNGVIETPTDIDVFQFYTADGWIYLSMTNAAFGGMLDCKLVLYDAFGNVITSVDPAISTAGPDYGLQASINLTLSPGFYYVGVTSHGGYGDVGQYSLTGNTAALLIPEPAGVAIMGMAAMGLMGRGRRAGQLRRAA